jgi:hypothetical protein
MRWRLPLSLSSLRKSGDFLIPRPHSRYSVQPFEFERIEKLWMLWENMEAPQLACSKHSMYSECPYDDQNGDDRGDCGID